MSASAWARLIAKGGEPLIRKGVDVAMRMMGEQFVTGANHCQAALANSRRLPGGQGLPLFLRHARARRPPTAAEDAQRYLSRSYEQAIHAIGQCLARGRGVYDGPGISVKLSALASALQPLPA